MPHFPGEETEAQRSYFLRKNRDIFYPKCWHQNPCISLSCFCSLSMPSLNRSYTFVKRVVSSFACFLDYKISVINERVYFDILDNNN